MTTIHDLATPSILVRYSALEAHLATLQQACDAGGVELRPHIKTHKMVACARRQLELGAKGLTCAKLSEAEAMLPSGVREIFIAHSLVDPRQAGRIAALVDQLDELRLAVTSEAQLEPFLALMDKVDRDLPVMLAVNTGLEREGVRNIEAAVRIAARLAKHPRVRLAGLYSHEGQFYSKDPANRREEVDQMLSQLEATRDAIDPGLALWPGCSVTGRHIAQKFGDRVQAVRPGAYLFGDLSLSVRTGIMPFDQVALQVLVTVVDKPTDDLALIDGGSKTFSSDRTPQGLSGIAADGRDLQIVGVNEEHGYVRGADVATLRVGERVAMVPAHVCTVINLVDRVQVLDDDSQVVATWPVDARGRIQ